VEIGKKYVRDKRSPQPKNENVSRVMSANKAKDTKPEIALRKLLWNNGLKGYRVNYKKIPGRPDITFVNRKVAIFVHGCFWHRCPTCNYPSPKTNKEFWETKFSKNKARDAAKENELTALSYTVITIWECELKGDIDNLLAKIKMAL